MYKTFVNYIKLTKPRIMTLVVFSGITALFIEGSFKDNIGLACLIIVGLYLTGGSANAFNQYLERDIDAKMTRTNKRRPLPTKQIDETKALIFAILIGLSGVMLFFFVFNVLSALISLVTILFYSFFYTLYLKPTTPQNIVIGGIAGATPPLIAWVAMRGDLWNIEPWALFILIFLWTPPHFWALALYFKEDYKLAGLPMLPVIKGDKETLKIIFIYTLILVTFSLVFAIIEWSIFLLVVSSLLNAIFLTKAYRALKLMSRKLQKNLFGYSVIYLFALFAALIIDNIAFT